MIKSKTWVKDRYFEFQPGDIVKLVRKKKNGHPRALELGQSYKVMKVENDDLFLQYKNSEDFTGGSYVKVNKDYFVTLEKLRDEFINEILNND